MRFYKQLLKHELYMIKWEKIIGNGFSAVKNNAKNTTKLKLRDYEREVLLPADESQVIFGAVV